jgi:hypothetical protein
MNDAQINLCKSNRTLVTRTLLFQLGHNLFTNKSAEYSDIILLQLSYYSNVFIILSGSLFAAGLEFAEEIAQE